MKRSTSVQHRQAQWRERLVRQEQSSQSVAAFCKSEGIAAQTFYWWRARLGKYRPVDPTPRPREAAPFIDLGALATPAEEAPNIAAGSSWASIFPAASCSPSRGADVLPRTASGPPLRHMCVHFSGSCAGRTSSMRNLINWCRGCRVGGWRIFQLSWRGTMSGA